MPVERTKRAKIKIDTSGKGNKTISAKERKDSQKTENIRSRRLTNAAASGEAARVSAEKKEILNRFDKFDKKLIKISTSTVKPGKTRVGPLSRGGRGGGMLGGGLMDMNR